MAPSTTDATYAVPEERREASNQPSQYDAVSAGEALNSQHTSEAVLRCMRWLALSVNSSSQNRTLRVYYKLTCLIFIAAEGGARTSRALIRNAQVGFVSSAIQREWQGKEPALKRKR